MIKNNLKHLFLLLVVTSLVYSKPHDENSSDYPILMGYITYKDSPGLKLLLKNTTLTLPELYEARTKNNKFVQDHPIKYYTQISLRNIATLGLLGLICYAGKKLIYPDNIISWKLLGLSSIGLLGLNSYPSESSHVSHCNRYLTEKIKYLESLEKKARNNKQNKS